MILEFVSGAVAQLGRYVGRAFGWSVAPGAAPVTRPAVVTGTWAVPVSAGTWAAPTAPGSWSVPTSTGTWSG